jgi:hypothetical protein
MNFLDDKIQINYNNKSIEIGNDLSSCVPISFEFRYQIVSKTINIFKY